MDGEIYSGKYDLKPLILSTKKCSQSLEDEVTHMRAHEVYDTSKYNLTYHDSNDSM